MKTFRTSVINAGIIIFAVLLLTFVFGHRYIASLRTTLNDDTIQYLTELSEQNALSIKKRVTNDLENLSSICSILSVNDFEPYEMADVLKNSNLKTEYKRLSIIFPNGEAHTTDGKVFNFSTQKGFRDALYGLSSVSDTLKDADDGKPINVYSVPIYRNGRIIAVLSATFDNQRYQDVLLTDSFGDRAFTVIITSDGNTILNSDNMNSYFTENIYSSDIKFENTDAREKIISDLKANKKGTVMFYRNGDPRYMSYTPIGINNWFVLSITPTSIVSEKTDTIIHDTIWLWVIIAFVAVLLLFYIVYNNTKQKDKMANLAYTDQLTQGLSFFKFQAEAEKRLASSHMQNAYIVIFDVDKFKFINDLYGRETGDQVLKEIHRAVSISLLPHELIARNFADHFVLFLSGMNADGLCSRLMDIQKNVDLILQRFSIQLSFGVYKVMANDHLSITAMVDRADMSRRIIKGNRDKFISFFGDELRNKMLEDKNIEDSMAGALENGEFVVYYQPKFHLQSGDISGAEALVRWQHPTRGLIPPKDFIPLFEKNGFIRRLDFYILEQVCIRLNRCVKRGHFPVPVSVNFSRIHLADENFVGKISEVVDRFSLPHRLIEVELTESVIFDNEEKLISLLKKLHAAGFSLSMDDFGIGYSSLGLLRTLPVDVLKFDRTFFTGFENSERAKTVISGMIRLSKELGVKTVAEGVETKEAVDILHELGCDLVQGYYFSPPVPDEEYCLACREKSCYRSLNLTLTKL